MKIKRIYDEGSEVLSCIGRSEDLWLDFFDDMHDDTDRVYYVFEDLLTSFSHRVYYVFNFLYAHLIFNKPYLKGSSLLSK